MYFANAYRDYLAGKWKQDINIPQHVTLEMSEQFLEGQDKKGFLAFMRKMLQWRPEDRATAGEMFLDPWLNGGLE